MSKQDKYTRSARGRSCEARTPVCNSNPETVVLAHLNGAGFGVKHLNIHGCYACSACHSFLDGGYVKTHTREQRDLMHLEAMLRTQIVMINGGVLEL